MNLGLPQTYCTTEGCNLKGVWNWAWLDGKPFLDLDQVYTNDIAATLRTYGVEAARAALITEVSAVFGVYGIDVNRRHLSLIADYMVSLTSLAKSQAQASFRLTDIVLRIDL